MLTLFKPYRRLAVWAWLIGGIVFAQPTAAQAAIETDPQALYAKMNEAYADGAAHGWTFDANRYYASAVFATGRCYSLFRHDDPNYARLAAITVDLATLMHYDPLNSDDASPWWVREAAGYVRDHNPERAAAATAILVRLDETEQRYADAARLADTDATANVASFHGDSEARVAQVIVDLRAATFSNDVTYRYIALARAAQVNFPLVRLPSKNLQMIYEIAQTVLDDTHATSADRANAKSVLARRNATPELQEIGQVTAVRHSFHLSITAPADEYFGRGGFSVLGIHNLSTHLGRYLDAGYGSREAGEGHNLTDALEQLQHTYPRDFELPKLIAQAMTLVQRIPDNGSQHDLQVLHNLLVYNYPDSAQTAAVVGREHTQYPADAPPHAQPDTAQAQQNAAAPLSPTPGDDVDSANIP